MYQYFEIIWYGIHLYTFYLYFIPQIGSKILDRCYHTRLCLRYIRKVTIPIINIEYNIDTADNQWTTLRDSLLLLWSVMIGTKLLSFVIEHLTKSMSKQFRRICYFSIKLILSIGVLVVLHLYHSLIIVFIVLLGYIVFQYSPVRFLPAVSWLLGFSVLLFKESYRLTRYQKYSFLNLLFSRRYGGLYGWQFPANFLALRLISVGMDMYRQKTEKRFNKDDSNSKIMNDNTYSHDPVDKENIRLEYDFISYFSYMLYAPLYMAGPIMTYSSFLDQSRQHILQNHDITIFQKENNSYSNSNNNCLESNQNRSKDILFYAIRWIGCFILMEHMLSKYPFFAVVSSGLMKSLDVKEIAVLAYVLLKIMWIKFLLIWRFFRLWSMIDGITPPENMLRCMSNNYSLEMFWKGWHASFNKWIVEYIYIPLGGSHRKWLSVWPIFLFVAIWHDFEWKLLAWGLLMSGFFFIEILAKRWSQSGLLISRSQWIQETTIAVSGGVYIIILIGVNLLGYAVGTGGLSMILSKIYSIDGMIVLFTSYYFLSIGVAIMRYLRRIGLSTP